MVNPFGRTVRSTLRSFTINFRPLDPLGLTQVRAKHARAIQPMLEHLIPTPRGKMLYACLLPDFCLDAV
jgi:hypothetical protein